MELWVQLWTLVLTLLRLGPSPSPSILPTLFTEYIDSGDVYAPEIFQPIAPNTRKADNAYNSNYTTDNHCNGPLNRTQWCYGKSINDDYENITTSTPNTGKVNKFTIVITNGTLYCGDGFCRNTTMLVNGTYPGPLIRGSWGDWFEITVINKLTNCNGTSIHWHGIRQWRSVWEDGVAGVTQCPIPPGETQVYKWRATQYGSAWYHSHFSLQYADGLAGPLVIDGPTSMNYEEDKGPLMFTDWYHVDAFSIYFASVMAKQPSWYLNAGVSVLVNGQGNWTTVASDNKTVIPGCKLGDSGCVPSAASTYITEINPSPNNSTLKFYKYRLINMSVSRHFSFWIDGHDFWVVATDFVPIVPTKQRFLDVAIGQRYDIIIQAKTPSELRNPNFWIKMRACASYCAGDPCPPGKNCAFVECRQGILSYNKDSKLSPDYNSETPKSGSGKCTDPDSSVLKPIVKRDLRGILSPQMKFEDPYEVDRRVGTQNCSEVFNRPCGIPDESISSEEGDDLRARGDYKTPKDGYIGHPLPPPDYQAPGNAEKPHIWDFGSSLNDTTHPYGRYNSFMVDWANYTLGLAAEGIPADRWNPRFVPIIVNTVDNWTVFAIASSYEKRENHNMSVGDIVPGSAHPIHLHGHDFVILRQESQPFYYNGTYDLDLNNPARRDVVMLPANGFIIVAFKSDNPGTWLMHCHIAWHVSGGMALEYVERPEEIPALMNSTKAGFEAQCKKWRDHEAKGCDWSPGLPAYQEDSGV